MSSHMFAPTTRAIIEGRIIEALVNANRPLTIHEIYEHIIEQKLPGSIADGLIPLRIRSRLTILKRRGIVRSAGVKFIQPTKTRNFLWTINRGGRYGGR